ncbi:MAG: FAD-binding protein, partial [Ardenticatenales bacterium]|nr:FAD-binding protein [Ardenticatenales bacterium]
MSHLVSRRSFLKQVAAGMIVMGFNSGLGSWVTVADASHGLSGDLSDFPQFDGVLVADETSLSEAADDFGHIIHRRPMAVLRPGSVEDIVRLVRFANDHGIKVAGQGQRHSTQGQAQVEAGVAIQMSSLATIREINATNALIEVGVRWIDLLEQTTAQGLTPPTLPDFIELSVGGTLSVGGIGGQAFRFGTLCDNVLELEVVTGKGKLVTCSPTDHAELFHACRAGLGQFAIIVAARVRLLPVPPMVRVYTALYADLATFMADQERLIDDGRFDYVEGSALPGTGGAWLYQIELAKYFTPGQEPNNLLLTSGLSYLPGTLVTEDKSYFDFANRLATLIAALRLSGTWEFPHPWVNLFVPAPATAFVTYALNQTNATNMGQGPILLYPMNRSKMKTPFFRIPDSAHFFVLSLLRTANPPTQEWVQSLSDLNRTLYKQAVAVGGKRYPIDSVPMLAGDWQHHYAPLW